MVTFSVKTGKRAENWGRYRPKGGDRGGGTSDVNHGGGQGGTDPSKVLIGGTGVLTIPPPKFKLRRNTAGSCFVRSHKEYPHIIILNQPLLSNSSISAY